jgi:hypothetical protein
MMMNLRGCFSLFGVDWPGARLKIEVGPWKFEWLLGKAPLTHRRMGKWYQDQSLNPQLIVGGMRIDDDNNAFRINYQAYLPLHRSLPWSSDVAVGYTCVASSNNAWKPRG